MSSDWQEGVLGDFIELKRGYDLPRNKRNPGRIPLVSSAGISDFQSECMVKGPGVVTGRYGTIGQVFYISGDFWPLNTTLYVRNFKGNDPKFVYYFLRTLDFKAYSDKAAVPGVNRNHLHEARALIPPLSIQRRIAKILGDIDDCIDVLRETNATLEAMAQAIFKSWFVDFDPVRAKAEGRQPERMDASTAALFPDSFEESELGLVPRGWRIGCVGDLAVQKKGSVNPLASSDKWFEHYSLPAFDNGQSPVLEKGEAIKSNKTPLPDEAVLLSKLNPHIPRVWLPVRYGENSVCSTEFIAYSPRAGFSKELIYCLFRSPDFQQQLCQLVTGTSNSHQRVKPGQILELKLKIPGMGLFAAFADFARPVFEQIYTNRQQAQTLTRLRDTLLPKLISGEIRLPEAESIVRSAVNA